MSNTCADTTALVLHFTAVVLVHEFVLQISAENLADAVKSLLPKLRPTVVTEEPPLTTELSIP
jgi:hypothetical protein